MDEKRLSTVLRIGVVCAFAGIAVGGYLACLHLDRWVHVFRFGPAAYGHFMLPSILLGLAAIALATFEVVHTGRYRAALGVIALGLISIVTPIILLVALIAGAGVAIVAAIAEA